MKDKDFPEFDFLESIPKGKKLVVAGKSIRHPTETPVGLVFLVDDVENPQIPGFPPYCLGRGGNNDYAEKFVAHTYQRLTVKPE